MDAFSIRDQHTSFVQGFLNIQDEPIKAKVDEEIAGGLFWPEPWLALNPAFESGGSIGGLVEAGTLHPGNREIFPTEPKSGGQELILHRHQTDAIRLAREQKFCVLTTGTGLGKCRPLVSARTTRAGSRGRPRFSVASPQSS